MFAFSLCSFLLEVHSNSSYSCVLALETQQSLMSYTDSYKMGSSVHIIKMYALSIQDHNTYFKSNIDAPTYSGMFYITWTTFKFNRNKLGTVSAYVLSSVSWNNQVISEKSLSKEFLCSTKDHKLDGIRRLSLQSYFPPLY